MQNSLHIFDTAVLVGFNPEGDCVYSQQMTFYDYYENEHIWDSDTGIQSVRLRKIHGYLFGSDGTLEQEFESYFNLETGIFESGWARFADGTLNKYGENA